MSRLTKPPTDQEDRERVVRRRNFRREIIGIFLGVSGAMVISSLLPVVRQNVSLATVMLWGGAFGGVAASFPRFEKAGAALTKGDNRVLNYAIGLGIPLIVLLLLALLR